MVVVARRAYTTYLALHRCNNLLSYLLVVLLFQFPCRALVLFSLAHALLLTTPCQSRNLPRQVLHPPLAVN